MQEEVQKDGGKSLDLINHPYIFMVRTIESLTSTSKLVLLLNLCNSNVTIKPYVL